MTTGVVPITPDYSSDDNEYMKELAKLLGNDDDVKSSEGLFKNQDMAELVRTYLAENIPKDIQETSVYKDFWAVFGNTVKLTFLEEDDVFEFELLFDNAKQTYLMSKPDYMFSFKDLQVLSQIRIYFIAAVKRAVGTKTHRFNERILLGGSINQNIRSNTEIVGSTPKRGMLSKLSGLFR